MRTRLVLGFTFALFLCGCPVAHQSAAARMQEAASELNVNARFGRMEMAAEHVAPSAREQFFERRRAWGTKIRVADYEMAGMRLKKGEEDAEMLVKIAWYRIDEGDVRVTTLKQKWHDFKGSWKLTEESRVDGDVGLLGEHVVQVAPPSGPRHAQFPTIRLGGSGPQAPEELPAPEISPAAPAAPGTSEPAP